MPRLPEVLKESLNSHVGKRLDELDISRQRYLRESSEVGIPGGDFFLKSSNMNAAAIGINQGERLPKITTPTDQIERLKTQPHPSTTRVPASLIDTRGVPLGKAGMTVGFTQPRIEPCVFLLGREAQHRHTTSTPVNQGRSSAVARRTVATAPPSFQGKDPREWLAQISLGLEDEEGVEDLPLFLIGKALPYWCSIDKYAPEMRPVDWEGFKHLMLARFSGDTVGSTVAKLQTLLYNGDFELLAEPFAESLAEGDHAAADLTLDFFLSSFRLR